MPLLLVLIASTDEWLAFLVQIEEGIVLHVAGGLLLEHPLISPFIEAVVSFFLPVVCGFYPWLQALLWTVTCDYYGSTGWNSWQCDGPSQGAHRKTHSGGPLSSPDNSTSQLTAHSYKTVWNVVFKLYHSYVLPWQISCDQHCNLLGCKIRLLTVLSH